MSATPDGIIRAIPMAYQDSSRRIDCCPTWCALCLV